MKNNHHILRTLKKQLRKEEANEPTVTQADQMGARLRLSMRKLSHPEDPRKVYEIANKEPAIKATILKRAVAVRLTQEAVRTHWLHSRGRTVEDSAVSVGAVVEHFFHVADMQETGAVEARRLIWLMFALGVTVGEGELQRAMQAFYKREPVGKVLLEEWRHFAVDSTHFPAALQRLLPPRSHTTRYECRPDISSLNGSPDQDLEIVRNKVHTVHSEFKRIRLARDRLIEVWKELDPKDTDIVMPDAVAEALVGLGIAVEIRAAKQVMKRMLGDQVTIQRREFLSLFTRSTLSLHISAVAEILGSESASVLTECTRFIIMSGLGMEDYPESSEIVKRLEALKTPDDQQFSSYEEYYKFMAGLLLPPDYVRIPSITPPWTVTPKLPESVTVETMPLPEPRKLLPPPTIPIVITTDMPVMFQEDAEEIRKSDPKALEGKIVFSEMRPVSEKASMRSTVTDLQLAGREKRYSLQERLSTESHSDIARLEPPATAELTVQTTSVVPTRNSTQMKRRKTHSRATTAPSISVTNTRGRSGLTSTVMSGKRESAHSLHSDFDRLVSYVPDSALGLFLQ